MKEVRLYVLSVLVVMLVVDVLLFGVTARCVSVALSCVVVALCGLTSAADTSSKRSMTLYLTAYVVSLFICICACVYAVGVAFIILQVCNMVICTVAKVAYRHRIATA